MSLSDSRRLDATTAINVVVHRGGENNTGINRARCLSRVEGLKPVSSAVGDACAIVCSQTKQTPLPWELKTIRVRIPRVKRGEIKRSERARCPFVTSCRSERHRAEMDPRLVKPSLSPPPLFVCRVPLVDASMLSSVASFHLLSDYTCATKVPEDLPRSGTKSETVRMMRTDTAMCADVVA